MALQLVKKRDGSIVDFDRSLIERAITKASEATQVVVPEEIVLTITDGVIEDLIEQYGDATPDVETIQDTVERRLVDYDLYEVAKAYILYRSQRQAERDKVKQETIEKVEKQAILIKKRDGSLAPFDQHELERTLYAYVEGYPEWLDTQGILMDWKKNFFDGISTKEIHKALNFAVRTRIEQDPIYSSLAARVLLNDLYKEVLGVDESAENFVTVYRSSFPGMIAKGIETDRLDARLAGFDLEKLAQELDPTKDQLFTYLGMQTLYDRYFQRGLDQLIVETPQFFLMRIAMGLAILEQNKTEKALEFYQLMSSLRYIPSTPTLFHAGTTHPQMSSCYVTTVTDDLNQIFKAIGDNAQLAKWSGGLGNDWTNIRGTGSWIKSTNVGSQGVIPFLKIVDSTTAAINRSGKRRGATCVYLETWHYDIEAFLELRRNTGDERRRTHDTNTCNWIPDLFMKRVEQDAEWTLFSPDETPDLHDLYGQAFETRYKEYEQMAKDGKIVLYKTVSALKLWRKMITMLFETGHPWITFKDPCNVRNTQDHAGVIHSSNLCTEITLNTSIDETAVCNLGSVNLSRHIENGVVDWKTLETTITTAMRMLDNVVDLNFYPTKEARNSNLQHRPVGLGVMGIQDALYKVNLQFDSLKAVAFSDEVQEFVSYYAILTSSKIAKEKGKYASFQGSKWDRNIFPIDSLKLLEADRGISTEVDYAVRLDWDSVREHVRQYGMRNSNCMAIAPTATISNIAGCCPTVEPIYKNLYVKSNVSGEFTVINGYLIEELKREKLWDQNMVEKLKFFDGSIQNISEIPIALREKYKEVFEVDPSWIILHAAHRGKWIDQSQSVNIFSTSTSGKYLSDIYFNAWKSGLKTTYYLRILGASSIQKSTLDLAKKFDGSKEEGKADPKACLLEDPTCEACQ